MTNRTIFSLLMLLIVCVLPPSSADAQVIGTFRWRTAPFCNVLNLTVTKGPGVFTLDGFDDACGSQPRHTVHGIAVPQLDGTITLGLNIVHHATGPIAVALHATISPATISGTWIDDQGHSGVFTFNPSGNSGAPRPGFEPLPELTESFSFGQNGAFAAVAGPQADPIPASGTGTRMMWHVAKSAFRAGRAEGAQWDDASVGEFSTAFGNRTRASGTASFATGQDSVASSIGAFAAGLSAVATGDVAIALGSQVQANAANTVVLGAAARANLAGSFVFGDASTGTSVFAPAAHSFTVRASGGVTFFSNTALTSGVELGPGDGSWASVSDVNMKDNFREVDHDDVLMKIARVPIREWNYKAQDASIRHVGPTAQDFHAAFGLGLNPLRISTIDADGIALSAIQALERRTRASDERNRVLEAELATLHDRLVRLEQLLAEKR
jgi:hypothetical protein